MGLTRFAGPVLGAKTLLGSFSVAAGAVSSNASTTSSVAIKFVVPSYEEWYATEFQVSVSTCTSNAASFKLKRDAASSVVTIATVTSGTSTSINTVAACSITAGEYEGYKCAAGSTVYVASSGNSAMGITHIQVHGFRRYLENSSRVLNS